MADLVSVTEIRQAAARLEGVVVRTPLVSFPGGLLLKPESLQPTGSFKLRGAYNAISILPGDVMRRGVVTHSSGNHGYAVAYAARLLGVPAVVVVPENAPAVKTEAITSCGAELVTVAPTLDARIAGVREVVAARGSTLIPPFDDRNVIAGQGTVGLEIVADCPRPDLVVVPVSGGGLISGIAAAVRAMCPDARVVGVEPALAADARASFQAGERIRWSSEQTARTVADALRVEQVGELTFPHVRELVSDIVTVTEEEILEAVRHLALRARLVVEPGGAVAVAACMFRSGELPAGPARVAVVSGGNIDPSLFARVLG